MAWKQVEPHPLKQVLKCDAHVLTHFRKQKQYWEERAKLTAWNTWAKGALAARVGEVN